MRRLRGWGRRLALDEGGSTAVEYGLLMAAFVLCLFAAASALRGLQASAFRTQHEGLKRWRAP
ncbi:MAG: Flp family type IVb pilin [Candidatus Sericytochromatia bacterium]|nr:Flp family type IVb pilin [Candidatus Sericytochromatia bacterium]